MSSDVQCAEFHLAIHTLLCRAAGSNLRMVRSSLMLVVKLSIIHTRIAPQNFGPSYFSCQEGTSASNLLSSLSLAVLNVITPYGCALTYVPCRIYYSSSVWDPGTTPHKGQTHNYVSTSAENGPAMAGPAGPFPAPMLCAFLPPLIDARWCEVALLSIVTITVTKLY